jgi:hypothetical protein
MSSSLDERDDNDWLQIFDESTGKYYYHNRRLQVTTWTPPGPVNWALAVEKTQHWK